MKKPPGQEKVDAYLPFYNFLLRVGMAMVGLFILIWQTVYEENKEWYVWATAISLISPAASANLAEIIRAFRGLNGSSKEL